MARKLIVLTINTNGLKGRKERIGFFLWLKTLHFDIIFLQETHCGSEFEANNWADEWGPRKNSIWSTVSSNSKGVAVLFKPHGDYKPLNTKVDKEGRYIYFDLNIEDIDYRFLNVYAPNNKKDRIRFYKMIIKFIEPDMKNIVGGDFNCTFDPSLDRLNCISETDGGREELKQIISQKLLEDIYRRRFPDKRTFSFSRGNKASRLDYFLVSEILDSQISRIEYVPCPFSDHDVCRIDITNSDVKQGPGVWKMNASVIKNDLFRTSFKSMWALWQNQKENYNPQTWWDLGKKKIKELTIWCASKIKADMDQELKYLEFCLNKESSKTARDLQKIKTLEDSIRKIYQQKAEGSKIRSRAKWFEQGEKPTRYFHNLEKYHAKNKDWDVILNEKNQLVYGTDEIMQVQVDFYSKLYSSEGSNEKAREYFGEFISKKVTDEHNAILNKKIEVSDIFSAIKSTKKNSSPGPDGIIYEFYREFFDIIKDDLLYIFSSGYSSGSLSYSQYLAIIILLYKKGEREKLGNWRPISLNNTDVKILSKILAERLKKVLPYIIHMNQCGCVKGRKIGQGIRFIDDILQNLDDRSLIMLDDKEKAFDRVEWPWLFFVMKKFGFGDYFINWIQILYKDMKSAVLTNGFVSPFFKITRGIRQGDALSALLYILQSEALSEAIRCTCKIKGINVQDTEGNFHELKGSQYVDDSSNMLLNVDYLHECLGLIDFFGEASGSRVNKGKSLALVSQHFADDGSLEGVIKVKKGVDIVLGVPVGEGPDKRNFWIEKIEKMKKRIALWKPRNLTMFGKIHVSKSLVLPLIQYSAAHIDIDDRYIEEIQTLIWSYIWKWKTCFVSKPVCYLPRINGGLGAPNVEYMIKAARIKMLINIMSRNEEWNILARKYLCCLDHMYDIKNFALLVTNSINDINKCQIPMFYKKIIVAFQELNSKALVKSKNEIIWCNNDICDKGSVFELKHWSRNGVKYVSDVVNDIKRLDIQLVTNKLHQKLGCARYIFEYAKLSKCFPDQIVKSCDPCDTPNFENLKYRIPGKKEPVGVFHLETKDIYSVLVEGGIHQRKSETYWQSKFTNVQIDFSMIYKCLFVSKIIQRDALDFNFRIFNGQVLMEKYLVKMKLSDGRCKICGAINADVMHLFLNCSYFDEFWTFVLSILCKIGYKIVLPFNRIFGFLSSNNVHEVANMMLSWSRWLIWKRHCDIKKNNELTFMYVKDQFIYSMRQHITTLIGCHLLNMHSKMLCEKVLLDL